MRLWFALLLLLPALTIADEVADLVLVRKQEARLYLMREGEVLKSYSVALGADPVGHKEHEGDRRTPEGRYLLDYKNPDSDFYKSIRISYPNDSDRSRAASLGIDPGGQIMIHGQKNGYGWLADVTQRRNWTDGCIAVSNADMDEIWHAVEVGTPIEIRP